MGSEFVLCDGASVCGSEHGFCGSVQGPGDLGCSDRVLDLSDHVAMDAQVSVEPFSGALPDEEVLGRGEPVVERRSVRRRGPVASPSAVLLGQCCCLCVCSQCGKNQFDNSKTGRAAQPQCTSYLNFLGFFEDSPMPVVLSFARTNYNEGRKMLSIAKSMRSAIWDYAYTIESRLVAKDRNKWYIMVPSMAGPTTPEQRKLAFDLYSTIHVNEIKADYEDAGGYANAAQTDAQVAEEI